LLSTYRDGGFREQVQRATERNKSGADLADGAAVILAEIGNRLVIGTRQPLSHITPTLPPASRSSRSVGDVLSNVERAKKRFFVMAITSSR